MANKEYAERVAKKFAKYRPEGIDPMSVPTSSIIGTDTVKLVPEFIRKELASDGMWSGGIHVDVAEDGTRTLTYRHDWGYLRGWSEEEAKKETPKISEYIESRIEGSKVLHAWYEPRGIGTWQGDQGFAIIVRFTIKGNREWNPPPYVSYRPKNISQEKYILLCYNRKGNRAITADEDIGERHFFAAWTPYGLADRFDGPFIRRIQKRECSMDFIEEICASPLDQRTVENLLWNMRNYKREDGGFPPEQEGIRMLLDVLLAEAEKTYGKA